MKNKYFFIFGISLLCLYLPAKSQALMNSEKQRTTFSCFYGGVNHIDKDILHNLSLDLFLHSHNCLKKDRIRRVTASYLFSPVHQDIGIGYKRSFVYPSFGKVLSYPFIGARAGYYRHTAFEGYTAKPELGVSFVLNRRRNPCITFDFIYGYVFDIEDKGYYPFGHNRFNVSMGVGLVRNNY